ncbi:MAG: MBL fold metallo-hydrolase, partial [Candidatus Omnitrophica bacterium]|nr:MBL fold metallo-hydrolase [Candidatus Omnitrophota bacterium]
MNRLLQKTSINMLIILLILAAAPLANAQKQTVLRVHVFSVGYGDAILIELPNGKSLMIDAGPKESIQTLEKKLHELNISALNSIILTHPHDNHYGGLKAILEMVTIRKFFTTPSPLPLPLSKG